MDGSRVLIAGAGPTGLVLALWLARDGVRPRLIDRKAGPGEGSRAMVVQARTLEFYRQLGIADEVVAGGFRVDRLHLRNRSGRIATVPLGKVGEGLSPFPFVLSFPQDDHERLLIGLLRAAGVEVEWQTELIGLSEQGDRVRAALRTPVGDAEWSGAYLCGCDGARSAARQAIGVAFPGGTYDRLFFVADAESAGVWSDRELTISVVETGFCLTFPVRDPGMFRYIGLVPEALRGRDVDFDDLREGVEEVSGTRIRRVNWFSTYRVHHRVADRFRRGRVFLAGDAGHVHSPVGGQGMNTGIGDAVNLAWKLAAVVGGGADPSLLDSYEAERVPFARSLVATTDRVFDAVVGRGPVARLVRTVIGPALLPITLRFEAVRRAQFRLVSQTRIAYRSSPISEGSAGSVRAGDRLPWVPAIDNFAPLSSRSWQIHTYGPATEALRAFADDAGLPLLEWPRTEATRRAGLDGSGFYLIRPDGHVGLASGSQDVGRLRAYLDRLGLFK